MQKAVEYVTNLSRRIGVALVETHDTVQMASAPYAGRVKL